MVSEKGPNELVVSEKGLENTRSVEWALFYNADSFSVKGHQNWRSLERVM